MTWPILRVKESRGFVAERIFNIGAWTPMGGMNYFATYGNKTRILLPEWVLINQQEVE